ncbi:conserved hypothetical protein [Pyrenophora tritici-repentis Pt-1C-BFP]|uniref:Uncharacterized protein n=1 Tax=Pyrenophora tritici-repentis (strain Pt-1C-BFP) TaxID=426418 RepID=B2WBK3_PYRTR|nr:uncharacterized protein PTRG_07016 [Pyrenophora tritici-repentis Pt-1C-BFP]EDU49935.1 conserved hypothetical protein [Pyrenophora tritici-repentis Pt-1C-BFP]
MRKSAIPGASFGVRLSEKRQGKQTTPPDFRMPNATAPPSTGSTRHKLNSILTVMADISAALSSEITRILQCIYPASLFANSSKSDFEHLPDGVLLPAEAQGFFLNSFQKAIQAPSVDTLSLLPSDVRRKFDAGLCGILKSNSPGESSTLLSWVCGIVFATEHPEGVTSIQTPSANEQPVSTESLQQQWKTISGQKLFGSMGHLYKTISLFVDQDVKNSWGKQDQTTRTLFKKFPEKISVDPESASELLSASLPLFALVATTIASLLVVAFAADLDAPKLPNALIVALIKKQQNLPPIMNACSHSLDNSPPSSISLFQQASTQYTGQHLQEWKERINSVVDSQSKYQKELFTREVAKYCEDLETRCNTVEEPLRREEERSKRLEGQVERLLSDIESLSKQREDDMHYQEGLEKDLEDAKDYRNRVELEQRRMIEEKEEMSAKLQDVEEALERTNRQAEDMLNAAQEDFAEKETNFRSTLLQREDEKRHRDAEMESLRIAINELRESQVQWEKDHYSLAEEHERLRARCCDTEELLQKERENANRQADELSRLESQLSEYQQDLEHKETELRDTNERLKTLQGRHEELRHESEERLRNLAAKHADTLDAAILKAEEEREEIGAQLQNALQAFKHEAAEHEKTSGEAQRLRESIPPLKSRIQELQKICTEQEEELESLRNWHTEMLAHLKQPLNVRPSSRSYKDAIQPQPTEERTHRRRKSTRSSQDIAQKAAKSPQVLTNTVMDKATDDSFVSPTDSYSSQGDGPAPKRPKPQSNFKSMRQRSSSLQDDEQADFGMDDDFTSGTPLTPGYAAGTGRAPEDDDGSMTEL